MWNSSSQSVAQEPLEIWKVKTIFREILRPILLVSLSYPHKCIVEFGEGVLHDV